jgi:predicted nucleic acid-binding protein
MIFVDSNIFIYAVGRPHPLKDEAQNFFIDSSQKGKRLVTSAEVLQELLHAYLPVGRLATLDAAMSLAVKGVDQILPIDSAAVIHAHNLVNQHPGLTATQSDGIENFRSEFRRCLCEKPRLGFPPAFLEAFLNN